MRTGKQANETGRRAFNPQRSSDIAARGKRHAPGGTEIPTSDPGSGVLKCRASVADAGPALHHS